MKIHELKIEKRFLDDKKRFEVRKDDRNYVVGDLVHLNDVTNLSANETYEVKTDEIIIYCHEECTNIFDRTMVSTTRYHALFRIIYILRDVQEYGLQNGYCILGLEPVRIEVRK